MDELQLREGDSHIGLQHMVRLSGDATAPAVFLVHGRAGDRKVMQVFRRCIPDSFTIFSPQAPQADPLGGFSWWDIERVGRSLVGASLALPIFLDFVTRSLQHYGRSPRVKIALGFSQGGGLLSLAAQEFPALFQGIGILSGFVIRSENSQKGASLTLAKVLVTHGTDDATLSFDSCLQGIAFLEANGFEVQFQSDKTGHKVGSQGMHALRDWLSNFAAAGI